MAEINRFIAIYSDEVVTNLSFLSPKIMKVSEHLWLIDMAPAEQYWLHKCKTKHTSWEALLSLVLKQTYVEPFYVVMGDHPWKVLLAVHYAKDRHLAGLVDLDNPLGRRIYQNLSWRNWFQGALALESSFAATLKKFNSKNYQAELRKFKKFILKIKLPFNVMRPLPDSVAMKHRFGSAISQLWQWSENHDSKETTQQTKDFPWCDYLPPLDIRTLRYLDFPLDQWAHLEELLKEDLAKLVIDPMWDEGYRVNFMRWNLTLQDMSQITIPIMFRHPHSLGKDFPEFKATLDQIELQFNKQWSLLTKDCPPESYQDILIIGWELVVEEWSILPPRLISLFADLEDDTKDFEALKTMENQIEERFESYGLNQDFLPEDMASLKALDEIRENDPLYFKHRPLFVWKKPKPYESSFTKASFQERVAIKWWEERPSWQNAQSLARNYYKTVDSSGKIHWVFQDDGGNWYEHGIY